jgi:hypothetical protein
MKNKSPANRGTGSPEARSRIAVRATQPAVTRLARIFVLAVITLFPWTAAWSAGPLVLQSDFGVKDSAVASMKGVAVSVSRDLDIYDLTHEVPTYNIWEASLRLAQAAEYWPKGTVFVSVVDPGVGTQRKSVVLETKSGHYFVSPDNGSLTAVVHVPRSRCLCLHRRTPCGGRNFLRRSRTRAALRSIVYCLSEATLR